MAWTFVGVSAAATATGTPLTLTEPAGVADGDLLIACIASRTTSTTSIVNTGWTPVNEQKTNDIATTTSAIASGVMLHRIRAGTPDLTFTLPASGTSVCFGRMIAYRGSAQTTPLDVSTAVTTATNTTAVSVAGLTTTQDNDLIVAMAAGGQEAAWSSFNATTPAGASGATDTTTAPSATWIERADSSTTTGADTSLAIFDAIKTSAGATGNLTATASLGAGHVIIAGAFKILVPPTADAWNKDDKSASITLSNSDKTLTTVSGTVGARSTASHLNGDVGKYYAEFSLDTITSALVHVGVDNLTASLSTTTGPSFSVKSDTSAVIINNVNWGPISTGALVDGDVVCVAWNSGAERAWFRINGGNWDDNVTHNPATGVGGYDVSFAAAVNHALWFTSLSGARVVTVRTELAEFTQTVPSGFTSWMGETPSVGDIDVPVTGVSATGSVGSVTVATVASIAVPVTGVEATGAVDQVTAIGRTPVSTAVTGVAAAGAVDGVTIVGKANVSTTGVAASGSVGSVTVATAAGVSVPVTGVEATGAVGTVTVSTVTRVDVAAPVTGVEATGSVGSVSVTGKASTTVTGVQATGAVGTVTVVAGTGASVPVTGVSAAGQVGSVTATGKAAATVTGVQAAGSVGSVTVVAGTGVTVPVTGVSATGSVDSVSVTGKADAPVTGVAATGTIGGVSVTAGGSISTTVTGVEATASVGSVTVTAAELAGLVGVWNGSAWIDKPAKVWTGSAWMQKPVKHWSGSAWV